MKFLGFAQSHSGKMKWYRVILHPVPHFGNYGSTAIVKVKAKRLSVSFTGTAIP